MIENNYKYDVAFSFIKEDEILANQIDELIHDRVSTFIYSKQQEKVAGTDGEKTFNDVFGRESRIVVVLFRNNWGKTPWTRIEATAIRNRAYDDGYDFVILIPLEKKPKVPKYIPKSQIWVGLERWGINGAASVIESRVQMFGGNPKAETSLTVATKIKENHNFELERQKILESSIGVQAANSEVQLLFDELEKLKQEIKENIDGFELGYSRKGGFCTITYGWLSIELDWGNRIINTLLEAKLHFTLFRYERNTDSRAIIENRIYRFDINRSKIHGWTINNDRDSFISTNELAQQLVKILLKKHSEDMDKKKSEKYL